MTINYYLRSPQEGKEATIQLFIRWNEGQLVRATGVKVYPKHWSKQKQRVLSGDIRNDFKNKKLEQISRNAQGKFDRFEIENGYEPSKSKLKDLLSGNKKGSEVPKDFFGFIDYIIRNHEQRLVALGKKLNNQSVANGYRQTSKILKEFKGEWLTFHDIDLDFYYDFLDFCLDEKKYTPNNTGKHVKNIKAILNEALELGVSRNIDHKSKKFKVLNEPVENIYLNEEELSRLEGLRLEQGSDLEKARDLFILGAWTGLRISDFKRIEKKHLIGEKYLTIRTEKTKELVTIPVMPVVSKILVRYDFKLPHLTDQRVNILMKELGEIAGIDETIQITRTKGRRSFTLSKCKFELISSHTARRSFVSNLYMRDVPTLTLMKITGHKTEKAFMRYLKISSIQHAQKMERQLTEAYQSPLKLA